MSAFAVNLPCTDSDPAHIGQLDPNQQWDLFAGVLRTNFSGVQLCIDALASTQDVSLVACDFTSLAQKFSYDNGTGHITSAAQGPCQAPASKGKQCHRCLDSSTSMKLSLWDCKQSSDKEQVNQQWTVLAKERGIRHNSKPAYCITGSSDGGGTVQAHAYGSFAFLSNTDDDEYLSV